MFMEEKRYLKRKEKAYSDGNREQLAISCNHLGDFYNEQGKYEDAARQYEEEAEIYENMGKILEMAKAHRMIGEMFMLLSKFDNAKDHINIYLRTVKKQYNKVEEQRAYATLGRAHLLHGQSASDISASEALEQLTQAEKAFLRSLLLIKELAGKISKLEQLDMQARCYLNIGVVKEHMENFEESISYIEKAIKISKAHDLFELTHLCYVSMSLLYHCKKNDATSALRYCNLALEVAKRLPNKVQKICETLITKAEILVKVGDFASAKQILTKAYKKNTPNESDHVTIERMLRIVVIVCRTLDALITIHSDNYGECKILYERLGDACCQLQNYDKALEFYQKMLSCAELRGDRGKDLVPIYVSLYQTYKDNKQYNKALEFLWKEYEINKDVPREAFTTLCSIAEVCEIENQTFWTINDIYQKAKSQIDLIDDEERRTKLFRIVFARLKRLCLKHKMTTVMEEMEQEVNVKGIDFCSLKKTEDDDESDADSEEASHDQNTPDIGADICLEDLTDSNTSELDESEKQRPHRSTRGTRCLTIKRNNKGETQLHQACISGNLELVRRLLDQGHVVNVRDHAGWLPLHEACNHGFRNIVELLLDRGAAAAINDKGGTSCDGITPLYDACVNGFVDVVELLVERGADLTVKTDFGETCVEGLDKWRRSAKLTIGEQAHYAQVRTMLLRPLSKTGLFKSQSTRPLTNAHIEEEVEPVSKANNGDDKPIVDSSDSGSDTASECWEANTLTFAGEENITKWSYPQKKSSRMSNAGEEYRSVMQQLKHPNRPQFLGDDDIRMSLSHSSPLSSSGTKQKRTALLNTNEIDDSSWLINDLGPERKKRRFFTVANAMSATGGCSTSDGNQSRSNSKENLLVSAAYTKCDSRDNLAGICTPESTNANTQVRQKKPGSIKLRLLRSSSVSSNSFLLGSTSKSKKHQASLLDSGFYRFSSNSPTPDYDVNDTHLVYGADNNARDVNINYTAEPDSTTTPLQLLVSPTKSSLSPSEIQTPSTQSPVQLSNTVSFKIKIQHELLLVPVERRKLKVVNMHWLAEEAARRYYNLIGLKPILRLKTSDGFAYEDSDSLSVAVEQNMIVASVLEWKIAPLAQRYEEMCHQLSVVAEHGIQCALEKAQLSNDLYIEGMWLQPKHTQPLFKALLHQNNLRVLDLSNNFIQNEGCRQLSKSLPTLMQLKVLNLKGNLITCEGLECLFFTGNASSVQLNELQELNLSQNPLGNNCLKLLNRLCDKSGSVPEMPDGGASDGSVTSGSRSSFGGSGIKTNALHSLSLSQCGITNIFHFDCNYYHLQFFDISFNHLSVECLRTLFNRLNCSRLQSINLAYTYNRAFSASDYSTDSLFADAIVEFFETGNCERLKHLTLCGCNLGDSNLYRIIQGLKKASALDTLDLSDNPKLSGSALRFIMSEAPQLRKLIVTNCPLLLDQPRIEAMVNWTLLPNLMNLTIGPPLGDSVSEDNKAEFAKSIVERLKTIWNNYWGDKAKSIVYDDNLILYINDKELQ